VEDCIFGILVVELLQVDAGIVQASGGDELEGAGEVIWLVMGSQSWEWNGQPIL